MDSLCYHSVSNTSGMIFFLGGCLARPLEQGHWPQHVELHPCLAINSSNSSPLLQPQKVEPKAFPAPENPLQSLSQAFSHSCFFSFILIYFFFCWVQWGCFPILITRSYQRNPWPSVSPQPPEAAGVGVISVWTGMEQAPGHRLGRCPSSCPCGRQEGSANERHWGKNGLDWSLAGPINSSSPCVG